MSHCTPDSNRHKERQLRGVIIEDLMAFLTKVMKNRGNETISGQIVGAFNSMADSFGKERDEVIQA